MARAYDPKNLDPESKLLKNFDDAWRTDLPLIRELTQQEKQAEEDRLFAASLAGIVLDEVPDDVRKMAMLQDDFDDDVELENTHKNQPLTTNQTTININNQSKP